MSVGRSGRAWAAAGVLVIASAARGDAVEPSALEAFQAWLDGSRTLEARFVQTLVSGAFGSGLEERGRMYVERPGRVRWDYLEPDPKVAFVLGDRTLLYLPEDRQLIRGKIQPEHAVLPDLLAGKRRLTDLFAIAPASETGPDARLQIELRPRDGDGAFVRAVVTVAPRTAALEQAEILDAAGNRTRFRFEGWRRNRDLPNGIFAFEPPAGTELVNAD